MMRLRASSQLYLIAILTVTSRAATPAAEFVGKVIAISHGDTLTVLQDRKQVKVRLHGIYSPEASQDFGARARRGRLQPGSLAPGTLLQQHDDQASLQTSPARCLPVQTDQLPVAGRGDDWLVSPEREGIGAALPK
jgi:hypothetical protein